MSWRSGLVEDGVLMVRDHARAQHSPSVSRKKFSRCLRERIFLVVGDVTDLITYLYGVGIAFVVF